MSGNLFPRFLKSQISDTLGFSRVTAVIGPRQSGKTTLVQSYSSEDRQFFTLDNEITYSQALQDPLGFVRDIDCCCIDEIQRVPSLIRAIKMSVDSDRRPGRFLLTGSADILTIPTISESLAGRLIVKKLYPLAQSEIGGNKILTIDNLFSKQFKPFTRTAYIPDDLEQRVLNGGYPDMLAIKSRDSKRTWAINYVETILNREVREISTASRLTDLTHLVQACAIQTSQLIVHSSVANSLKIDVKTVQRYINILEQIYIVSLLPAWHGNELKRLVKTPKLHFIDTGLVTSMRQIELGDLKQNRALFGPLLESFVYSELLKMSSWSGQSLSFYHFRDKEKNEVDFVITNGRGEVIGIEVKASATIRSGDLKGMKKLQNAVGENFKAGYVLYTGDQIIPMGDNVIAAPVSILWEKPQ